MAEPAAHVSLDAGLAGVFALDLPTPKDAPDAGPFTAIWGRMFIPSLGIMSIVALASTQSTRRRSWAHSILPPPAFTTPSPRLVRGRLRTAFSLSPPTRSGDVPTPLATNGDASSGFFAVRFFFLARGNVSVTPAFATGPRGTTAARSGDRGPNTHDKRCNGNRGGG